MGGTTIHYKVPKEDFTSPNQAFQHLYQVAQEEYGTDAYNGTISTCTYYGAIHPPANSDEYDAAIDRLATGECVHYEEDGYYNFIGWARC